MRVLILVLSCNRPPYDALYAAQKRTWDSVEVVGVSSNYYWCDGYEEMPWKLKQAIDSVWDLPWDVMFRTNSSSYVDKKQLFDRVSELPRSGCYSGVSGGDFISGSGMILSRDVVEILRGSLEDRIYNEAEDVVVGRILDGAGIIQTPGSRYDYWQEMFKAQFYGKDPARENKIMQAYHCRCKGWDTERMQDIFAFDEIHHIKMRFEEVA